tara:strand:+ start:602 stop:1081 length:480 start_codon:yes stop_codon:yes gene_type:complete
MSTALDFTRDINDLPPMNQRPLKAKNGMLVTPQRVKSDKMLSEAPPEDISTESKFIEYKGPTKISDTPNVFYPQQEMEMGQRPFDEAMQRYMMTYGAPGSSQEFEIKKSMGKVMTPSQLEMIMKAQDDRTGPMALLQAKNEPESGLARLIENLPKEYII